ncbi:MAG: imidazole glycerol phosphate synthase subunit HisH [Dehalococcoidia bacterium]|jgi:glutamine amidotransferase|nr:imidazole glycerol phosphate synthase subunit HisH [Dehalococcoidia bacterium]MDP7470412.1 imidazole glycerol phosphate synthase subunit HisH [Dehalococcoidia bacterium]
MIALIDYGAGNLKSVAKAIAFLGYQATVTSSPADVDRARVVVLPGVGAARPAVERLEGSGLADSIRRALAQGRPFLGLCVGLQVLFTTSKEGGNCPCLDILPGVVVRLPSGLKVPHIGWNQVWQRPDRPGLPIFDGIPDGANFYFVHSYYASPRNQEVVAGKTEYGVTFPSVIVKDNLVATQFHPEKSGQAGLLLYHNFFSRSS